MVKMTKVDILFTNTVKAQISGQIFFEYLWIMDTNSTDKETNKADRNFSQEFWL